MKGLKPKHKCTELQISALDSNQSAYSEFNNNYNHHTSTNQNQSLLVSSSLRNQAFEANQTYLNKNNNKTQNYQNCKNRALKAQGKFNSKVCDKSKISLQQLHNNCQKTQLYFETSSPKKEKSCCEEKICKKCQQKITNLQRRVKQTQMKLQKIESTLNISYTKHMHQQTQMSSQIKEFQTIKHLIWETKKKEDYLKQETMSNQIFFKKEMTSMKEAIQKISNKVKKEGNQLKELIELQKTLLNQKLNTNQYNFQKKVRQLIAMVEEVSKLQNKLIIDKKDEQNKENIGYRGRASKSKEKANKISYYLSKSICNESTIIGDSSVNINSNFIL